MYDVYWLSLFDSMGDERYMVGHMESSDHPVQNILGLAGCRIAYHTPVSNRNGYVGRKVGKKVRAHCGKPVLETESNANLIGGVCMLGTTIRSIYNHHTPLARQRIHRIPC